MADIQTLLYNVRGVMNVNNVYIKHKTEESQTIYYNIMDGDR